MPGHWPLCGQLVTTRPLVTARTLVTAQTLVTAWPLVTVRSLVTAWPLATARPLVTAQPLVTAWPLVTIRPLVTAWPLVTQLCGLQDLQDADLTARRKPVRAGYLNWGHTLVMVLSPQVTKDWGVTTGT